MAALGERMKWTLYQLDEQGARVFVATFNQYEMAHEAHSRFIDANPHIASTLVFTSEN